jgi:hypothetical protein
VLLVGYAEARGARAPQPDPFLILSAVVGLLLGSWWIGLLVGIGITIIPGLALVALFVQTCCCARCSDCSWCWDSRFSWRTTASVARWVAAQQRY